MAGARTRRDFLAQGLWAGAALAVSPLVAAAAQAAPPGLADLRRLYPDLERRPPLDLSTRYVPKLGALLPRNADGRFGPVFKSFRTVLPEISTDCLGEEHPVSDFTSHSAWRRQTDSLRDTLRADFDHVILLADSLEFARTPASGFDGIGIYDNFVPPEQYRGYAEGASRAGLLFSFNVNPGYDQIEPRETSDPCYAPRDFAPPTPSLDFGTAVGRERAALASDGRIRASWEETLAVQLDPDLANARKGFLLVYVNSFNEWHEGHAFEPMKDWAELTPDERALGYRNPERGDYRLRTLAELQRSILEPALRKARISSAPRMERVASSWYPRPASSPTSSRRV